MKGNEVRINPFSFYQEFSRDEILSVMHKHGIYCLPTTELIEYLDKRLSELKYYYLAGADSYKDHTIEICAGHGAIAQALGIKATDRKLQEDPKIAAYYLLNGQPLIKYPSHVEKLTANQAFDKYRPKFVVASFCTHKLIQGQKYGSMYGRSLCLLDMVLLYIYT